MNLRPLERRLLLLQSKGTPVDAMAEMFKRSPEHIERVLGLIDLKLAHGAQTISGLGSDYEINPETGNWRFRPLSHPSEG